MTKKYYKYAVLCFLVGPLTVFANKYNLHGKNTKAEMLSLGLEIRNASLDKGVNRLNAKIGIQTYEIRTARFVKCKDPVVGVSIFLPPKGVFFSTTLSVNNNGFFEFNIRSGEEDSVLLTVKCFEHPSYGFSIVD